MRMFWYNLGAAAVFLVWAVHIVRVSDDMPAPVSGVINSGFWPGILGMALIVLSVALAAQTLWQRFFIEKQRGGSSREERPPIEYGSPGMRRVYVLCGIFLAFAVLLYFTNFIVAAAFISLACALLQGERVWWRLALITVGLPAAMQVIFVWILRLPLP